MFFHPGREGVLRIESVSWFWEGGGVGRMFDGRGGAKLRSRVGVLVEIEAISRLKPEDDELRSQSGTATSFFMRVLGGIVG